jgi:6-phosphogluconolactonase
MSHPAVEVLTDPPALAQNAALRFVESAAAAVAARGHFTVALSGGATPAGLYRLLTASPYRERVDWGRTMVFFGDERCVPPDHPDSNYRMVRETLLDHVPLPPDNVHRVPGERDASAAAAAYTLTLRSAFGLGSGARPHFDLILLGMGDDGHTASLFPGMPALNETATLVLASEVPDYVRPHVPRVTLSLPVINAANRVIFLVAGGAKVSAIRAVLCGPEPDVPLPARRVKPVGGALVWLLDEAAAAGLR